MSKMMIYAQKGAVGGNVERVWGYEMQVCTIDSSDEKAVSAAKANGYSDSPHDVIELIHAMAMKSENNAMKGVLSDGKDKDRIDELEGQLTTALEEIAGLESKLVIYEESKDANGDGVVSYDELEVKELRALLDQRDVKYVQRDGKDALVKLATDSE